MATGANNIAPVALGARLLAPTEPDAEGDWRDAIMRELLQEAAGRPLRSRGTGHGHDHTPSHGPNRGHDQHHGHDYGGALHDSPRGPGGAGPESLQDYREYEDYEDHWPGAAVYDEPFTFSMSATVNTRAAVGKR